MVLTCKCKSAFDCCVYLFFIAEIVTDGSPMLKIVFVLRIVCPFGTFQLHLTISVLALVEVWVSETPKIWPVTSKTGC